MRRLWIALLSSFMMINSYSVQLIAENEQLPEEPAVTEQSEEYELSDVTVISESSEEETVTVTDEDSTDHEELFAGFVNQVLGLQILWGT
jgi:hypothetical protein